MGEKYLNKVWDSVQEEGLTELQLHKRYYNKLNKELKGDDRSHLKSIRRKINELEMEAPFADLLSKSLHTSNKNQLTMHTKNHRIDGDGTEWIVEKDEDGGIFKRELGSGKKIYIKDKSQ